MMSDQDAHSDWQNFLADMGDIEPLSDTSRHFYKKMPPKPVPLFLKTPIDADNIDWVDPVTLSHIANHIKPGYSPKLLKNLRKGRYRCNSELDLHGYNRDEAREALFLFLQEAKRYQDECVCIVVGKGLRSKENVPVLQTLVKSWLMQANDVIAFSEAPLSQGGSGAIFVLLKISKNAHK